jgi:anti-sigma factor ChrR (cupin superfamily)
MAKATDRAALHALRLLPSAEASLFERDLLTGGASLRAEYDAHLDLVGQLGHAVRPVPPRPGLKRRLLERINTPDGLLALVRADAGQWRDLFPGVQGKRLFVDPSSGQVTALLKMEPGAIYPRHRHAGTEHCYVLQGDVIFDQYRLNTGDYEVAEADSEHSPVTTDRGCLLLILHHHADEVYL